VLRQLVATTSEQASEHLSVSYSVLPVHCAGIAARNVIYLLATIDVASRRVAARQQQMQMHRRHGTASAAAETFE